MHWKKWKQHCHGLCHSCCGQVKVSVYCYSFGDADADDDNEDDDDDDENDVDVDDQLMATKDQDILTE